MLKRICKLWKYLRYFALARKVWQWPQRSEVIIFEAVWEDVLREFLGPWSPEVLHVSGEKINVPVLLASVFRRGKRVDAYVDCFIERVRPRLIVTFIDNSPAFLSIAGRHPGVKTMFIQNGLRGSEIFDALNALGDRNRPFHADYMMCFGSLVGAKYAEHVSGTVVPIGSLRNNMIQKRMSKKRSTIAFISQYRDIDGFVLGGHYRSQEDFFERADRLVLPIVVNYAKTRNKTFCIVPSMGHDERDESVKREHEYYNRLLQEPCTFADTRTAGGSYDAVDSVEVVVTIDSTLGYESVARGNKTAIFSIRGTLLGLPDRAFGWPGQKPDTGPFWTNRDDPAVFDRILDHLFALDDGQWHEELIQHDFAGVMSYDPDNYFLRSALGRELPSIEKIEN